MRKKNMVYITKTYCNASILLPLTIASPIRYYLSQNFILVKNYNNEMDPMIDRYKHQMECINKKLTKYL